MVTMVEARAMLAEYAARIEAERFLHGESVEEFVARVRTQKGTYRKRAVTYPFKPDPVKEKLHSQSQRVDSKEYVFEDWQIELAIKVLESKNER